MRRPTSRASTANVEREPAEDTDALVISVDGKGIVMRKEGLRDATRKAAGASTHKLKTRLTRGEKKDRKRMAELAVVYDCKPVPRGPTDILARKEDGPKPEAPRAKAKWLTASVVEEARETSSRPPSTRQSDETQHTCVPG